MPSTTPNDAGPPNDPGFVWNDALTPMLEASVGRSSDSLSPELWQFYAGVARQAEQIGWSFETFVVALVEVHLKYCLPKKTLESVSLGKMCETIGRTLCGDPVSKARLQVLQEQLLSGPL